MVKLKSLYRHIGKCVYRSLIVMKLTCILFVLGCLSRGGVEDWSSSEADH